VPEEQTCCGALAAHDGAADEAAVLAAINTAAFTGFDRVVSNSAGCSAHLASYGHWAPEGEAIEEKAADALQIVSAAIADGRLPTLPPGRGVVGVQDPCHHRHALRMTAEPRRILEAAGYGVRDIDPSGMCCGAAGVYSLLRPDTADELGRRKADQVTATRVDLVASANPGCEIQLRSHLPESVRVAHPLELYWEAVGESRNQQASSPASLPPFLTGGEPPEGRREGGG